MDFEVENFDGEIDFDDDDDTWNKKKTSSSKVVSGKPSSKGKGKGKTGSDYNSSSFQSRDGSSYNLYASASGKPSAVVSKSSSMFSGGNDEDDAYDFAIDNKAGSRQSSSPSSSSMTMRGSSVGLGGSSSIAATKHSSSSSSSTRISQDGASTLMDAQKLLAKYTSKSAAPAAAVSSSTTLNRTVSKNQISKSIDIALDSDEDQLSGSFEYSNTEGLSRKAFSVIGDKGDTKGKNVLGMKSGSSSSSNSKFSDLTKKVTSSAYLEESTDDNSFSASLDAGDLNTKSVANITETYLASCLKPPSSDKDFIVEGDDDDDDDDDDDSYDDNDNNIGKGTNFNTGKPTYPSKNTDRIDDADYDDDSVHEVTDHSVVLSPYGNNNNNNNNNKNNNSVSQNSYESESYEDDYEDEEDAEVDSEYERVRNLYI